MRENKYFISKSDSQTDRQGNYILLGDGQGAIQVFSLQSLFSKNFFGSSQIGIGITTWDRSNYLSEGIPLSLYGITKGLTCQNAFLTGVAG